MAFPSMRGVRVLGVLVVLALVLGVVAYALRPGYLAHVLGWVLFAIVVVTVWFALEMIGTVVLSSPFFARMSSGGRVLLAVPTCAAVVAFGLGVLWFAAHAIAWLTGRNAI